MPITHLLDTSVYSQLIKKRPLKSVISRWKKLGDYSLCSSIICETEVLQGLELKDSANLWQSYQQFLKDRLPIMPFDIHAAKIYARLQAVLSKKGKVRPIFDLMIASSAISKNLTLATCNIRDFADIPGLKTEDWTR